MKLLALLWLLPAYPLLRRCSQGASPLQTGLLSAMLGFSGLLAACILSPVTGIEVTINFFTAAVGVLTGLPGVAGAVILAMLG